MPPVQSTLNTAFSGASTTSVNLFTNADCTKPFQLSDSSTPVLLDTCYNNPPSDIKSVYVSHHDVCADDEELALLISKEPNCSESRITMPLAPLAADSCHAFTSSADCAASVGLKSLKVVCRPTEEDKTGEDARGRREGEEETNILESPPPPRKDKRGNDVSVGVNANCCKACVVM